MSRREQTIDERGEPALLFFRRAAPGQSVELVIVEKTKTLIWTVPKDGLKKHAADLAYFVATEPT